MHEEKKEIITKEMIMTKYKRNNKPVYFVCGAILLFCILVFSWSAKSLIKQLVQVSSDAQDLSLVIYGVLAIGTVVIGFFTIRALIKLIKDMRDIQNDSVCITRAKFLRHVKYECPRTPVTDGYDMVYFQDGKHFKIHRNDGALMCSDRLSTALQLSENGDDYIVVTMANDPDTVVDLYCEKFYAYRE